MFVYVYIKYSNIIFLWLRYLYTFFNNIRDKKNFHLVCFIFDKVSIIMPFFLKSLVWERGMEENDDAKKPWEFEKIERGRERERERERLKKKRKENKKDPIR